MGFLFHPTFHPAPEEGRATVAAPGRLDTFPTFFGPLVAATRYEHCGCGYTDPKDVELAHLSYSWTLEHTSEDLACCLLLHLPATEDQGKLEPHNLAGKPALLHLDQPLLR